RSKYRSSACRPSIKSPRCYPACWADLPPKNGSPFRVSRKEGGSDAEEVVHARGGCGEAAPGRCAAGPGEDGWRGGQKHRGDRDPLPLLAERVRRPQAGSGETAEGAGGREQPAASGRL